MAFTAENIYVVLEGGTVLVITDVTDEKTASDVVIYDGETYRDDLSGGTGGTSPSHEVSLGTSPTPTPSGGTAESILGYTANAYTSYSDVVTHTAPRYKGKQRTLWSFPRASKFTHVTWADLVQGTSALAPYRLGMTPTQITS